MIRITLLIMALCFSHAHAQVISCKIEKTVNSTTYSMKYNILSISQKNMPLIMQVKPKGVSITHLRMSYLLEDNSTTGLFRYDMLPDSQYSDGEWDGFRTVDSLLHPSLISNALSIHVLIAPDQWYPVEQRLITVRSVPGGNIAFDDYSWEFGLIRVSEASVDINEIIDVPDLSGGEEHVIQIGTAGDFTLTGGGNVTIKAASGSETGTLADPFKTSHSGVTVALNNNGTIAPNDDITATVRVAPDAASGPYTLNLVATANCP